MFGPVLFLVSESVPSTIHQTSKSLPGDKSSGGQAPAESALLVPVTMPVSRATAPRSHVRAVFPWHRMISGESLFDLVAGSLSLLRSTGGDFAAATQTCVNDFLPNGVFLDNDPVPGDGFWLLHRTINLGGPGRYDTGLPNQIGERDPEIEMAPAGCPQCRHDKCMEGEPLDPGCADYPGVAGCVRRICEVDGFCCATDWDTRCIEAVRTVCQSQRCSESRGTCPHTLCRKGEALEPGCDTPPATTSCVAQICDLRPECCTEAWSDECVVDVILVCSLACD